MCSATSRQWQINSRNIQLRAGGQHCSKQKCSPSRTSSPEKLCWALSRQWTAVYAECLYSPSALDLHNFSLRHDDHHTHEAGPDWPLTPGLELEGASAAAALLQNAFLCSFTCFRGSRVRSRQCSAQHVLMRISPACRLHSKAVLPVRRKYTAAQYTAEGLSCHMPCCV